VTVDDLFSAYSGASVPGASVVVIRDGRVVIRQPLAWPIWSGTSRPRRDRLPLASVSKQFTAMAVMLLVKDGKLRYDQPVGKSYRNCQQPRRP